MDIIMSATGQTSKNLQQYSNLEQNPFLIIEIIEAQITRDWKLMGKLGCKR